MKKFFMATFAVAIIGASAFTFAKVYKNNSTATDGLTEENIETLSAQYGKMKSGKGIDVYFFCFGNKKSDC